ncbi:hypothetical protein [Saccharothrix syringae]|uniref:hypothetical protein n=1 Tax=Saccharothrix syringae TaxID=103733 RepID=UPI001B80A47D|nr:hypothetical protein [Saccharothrix syringae]
MIKRESRRDKEFHFQNWVGDRLKDAEIPCVPSGRNTYPDFNLVDATEGFEVKGLETPGRVKDFDSNSRMPSGWHDGKTVYYVFGRYPKSPSELTFPVLDLVVCHGDLLNADHEYEHLNDSFRGNGAYGDLLIRDRKMYVVPTPYALADGLTGQFTLIVPASVRVDDDRLVQVGELERTEASHVVASYTFDLERNKLTTTLRPNPTAGTRHTFSAYRMRGADSGRVTMSGKFLNDQLTIGEIE